MDRTLRALNRFGLGARVGEHAAVTEPRRWLLEQIDDPDAALLEGPGLEELATIFAELSSARRARSQDGLAAARRRIRDVQAEEVRRMLSRRIRTQRPFVERLVAFWSNHLCVSVPAKAQVALLAGHYERTVVRPHVMGRFDDMVVASAKHPAMLFYLDNFQSIGPRSRLGRVSTRRGNARGLNENYARELLELHTVGVDGGYGQSDVEALARVLTGWSVAGVGPASGRSDGLGFAFRPALHEPGTKTVMGRRYASGGVGEGEEAIRDLCARPATATYVATKLARHFVADEPPLEAVEELEATFRRSGGDLAAVSRTLVDVDSAWDPENRKLRTPQDWLVSVFRAVGLPEAPQNVQGLLGQLRHGAWAPPAPKGYGDLEREWSDPEALMSRAELARTIGRSAAGRLSVDPVRLLEVVDVPPDDPVVTLASDESIPRGQRVALLLGGPAFQWR